MAKSLSACAAPSYGQRYAHREDDRGGKLICERLEAHGHEIYSYQIVPDEPLRIAYHVETCSSTDDCDAVLLTGGTGIAGRDATYEAIVTLLDKQLDGFGEIFRMLSYEQIGPAAMLSRAIAGLVGGTAVFAMPGSAKGH